MPDFKAYVRRHLRLPGISGPRETDIVEELAADFEQRYERALRAGMTPQQAWEEVTRQEPDWREFASELGSILRQHHAEAAERERPRGLLFNGLADGRFALRLFRKSPAFAWSVVLVVALGIGPATAMFSAVYSVFWAPAPWAKRGEMVVLWSKSRSGKFNLRHGTVDSLDMTRIHVSPRDYADWKQQARSFQAFGASSYATMTLNDDSDRPERVQATRVTPGFLTMRGRSFVLGRDFLPEEGVRSDRHVVILGYRTWQHRFGADPAIAGKRVWLDGESYAVVGVTAASAGADLEVWPVLSLSDAAHQDDRVLTVLALLKRGVSLEQAQAEMNLIGESADGDFKISVEPARNDWLSARTGRNLWLLMGTVSLILLIACANVANLLLARGGARRKELAVRASLGAGRSRIFRQLLAESLLLSGVGGAAGAVLAYGLVKVFLAIVPAGAIPGDTPIVLNLPALFFAAAVTLVAGVLFGCAPAWQGMRINVHEHLKQGSAIGRTREGHRLLKLLVVVEFALTLSLLCTAALAMRTFWSRTHLDLGIRTDHLLTFEVPLRRDLFAASDDLRSFYSQLIARIRAIPGIAGASAVSTGLLAAAGTLPFSITGRPMSPNSPPRTAIRAATTAFFAAAGGRIVRGRNLDDHDLPDAAPVALVNEQFVRQFLAGGEPLGKEVVVPVLQPKGRLRIVGVYHTIENATEFGRDNAPEICVSFNQIPLRAMTVVVSSARDPELLRSDIATVLHSLDRSLPMANVRTVEQIAAGRLAFDRFEAALYGSFATLALLLAAVGMYGMVAYFVSQRIPEMGLRLALGASPGKIVRLVLLQGGTLAAAGLIAGSGCAWWMGRLMQSQLYAAGPPRVDLMLSVGGVLLATALIASWLPAQRAARVDPTTALRNE
jgi:putative ABC transport system permease protein